ncbi:hypothetical protein MKX03_036294, partial [Papaver bracteatum]
TYAQPQHGQKALPGKYWGTYRRILAKSSKNISGKKKKTAIVFGTLIPIFLILIFLALYRIHRKRKAAAAAGKKSGTSEPAIPTTSPQSTAT